MKRMVLLYGGKSGEHEVSCISAAGIFRHFPRDRFEPVLVGISRDGIWYLQDSAAAEAIDSDGLPLPIVPGRRVAALPGSGLIAETAAGSGEFGPLACDLVFPVLHGTFGEDGTIQGLVEVAGLACVGAGVLGSALGMDKEKAKELWRSAGLPIVDFVTLRRSDLADPARLESIRRKIEARFGWPAFAKPACAGSSVGASRIADAAGFEAAVRAALEWDEKALVEPFIHAREIECSVVGNSSPAAFAPGEILPSHEFYDYEAKYVDPEGAALVVPARLSQTQSIRVRELALAAFSACELSGMARVDFFIDRHSGEILLNEVNTIPGFTHISMFPRMCESGGLAWPDLIATLGNLALERFRDKSTIRYRH